MFCFFFRGVMEELEAEGMKFQCSVEKCGMMYKTRLGCQKHGDLKHPPADNFTVIDLQSQQVAPEAASSDTRDNRGRFASSSAVASRSSSSSPIVESPAAAERMQQLQRVRNDVVILQRVRNDVDILEQVEPRSLQPAAVPSARAAAVAVASDEDEDEDEPVALTSGSKSRCSACQQTGHISSNRNCPVKVRQRVELEKLERESFPSHRFLNADETGSQARH